MSGWGVRRNSWTGLCRQPETLPVLNRTECTKRDLDPFLVVPANVRVDDLDELVGADGLPVPRVKQFRLQPSKEAFARRVIGRAALARH
jgi:hypothetical protein